jgi:hypothetical protein
MKMASCRSSGVLTADAVISAERCKLISIHAQLTGTAATTVKVFDSATEASGKELARMILQAPTNADASIQTGTACMEFDMHGVLAVNGLFLQITSGGSTGAAVSVEYN